MARKISLKVAKKREARCSSLPLLFDCTNALTNPDRLTPVRVVNGFEELGTLLHAAIQHAVTTGDIDMRQIEVRYPEEMERAHILFNNGLKIVEEAKRDMKNPQFEVEIEFETANWHVTGHIDVLDSGPDRSFIIDFKTGRTRDDHYHQMMGYAVGAWTKVGRPGVYTVHIAYVYLESNEVTAFSVTAADMLEWIGKLDTLPELYAVNRRCVYCPLHDTCPAFRNYVKGSMGFLMDTKEAPGTIKKLDKAGRARLATALKMATDSVERIRTHIKEEAIKSGKDMDLGNGDKFMIVTQKRRFLQTAKALPILGKYVTAKDIAKASSLTLGALLTAAGSRAKGPMRAVIRKELEKKLEAAGAIVTTEQQQLRTVFAGDKKWPTKKSKPKPPAGDRNQQ